MTNQRINQTGFTLMEVLMVITLIGLLAGLVAPKLFSTVDKIEAQAEEKEFISFLQDVSYQAFVRNTPIRVTLKANEIMVNGDAAVRFQYLQFPRADLRFLASGFCETDRVAYRIADAERFVSLDRI